MERGRSDHDPSWQRQPSDHERRDLGKQRQYDPIESNRASGSSSSDAAGSSLAPSSAASTASAIKPSRKRRKQFKYMLSHARGHPSLPQHHLAQHNIAIEQHNARKESRKKVKKACIFCKRSHMPCEEARPCQRCVKRGISHLCRDAEPASSAKTSSSSSRPTNSDDSQRQHDDESETTSTTRPILLDPPGVTARDPDFKPMMPISHLLSPADTGRAGSFQRPRPLQVAVEQARPPSPSSSRSMPMPVSIRANSFSPDTLSEQAAAWERNLDIPSQHMMIHMLEAGPAKSDLNDIFGDKPTSMLIAPSMLGLPFGDPLLRPSSATTRPNEAQQQQYLHSSGLKFPHHPRHPRVKAESGSTSDTSTVQGYSYTYGFAKLARWMQTRYSRSSRESVDQSLAILRPRLLAISRSLPEIEMIELEESFTRLLHHYQANVLECVPVPMFITRRTGEIYAANEHMAKLMQLPISLFEGGQISHFQTVTETDAVELWKLYTDECMGRLRNPPSRLSTLEVDRSLLLYNRSGFDPKSKKVLENSSLCPDGSPAVLRKKIIISFEAKISRHGLPLLLVATYTEVPDPLPAYDPSHISN